MKLLAPANASLQSQRKNLGTPAMITFSVPLSARIIRGTPAKEVVEGNSINAGIVI